MANSKCGDRFFRPCKSTQTTIDQNLNTCTSCGCGVSKKRYDKSENDTISQKPQSLPSPVTKKTCTRCNSRRESTVYGLEPYYAESTIEFYETLHSGSDPSSSNSLGFEQPLRKASKNGDNQTPKEIMNSWMPGKERPGEPLFTPGEKYVDVTPRDFSLRKYFPELFLSDTEKREIRDRELKELEDIREAKSSQGNSCNPKNAKGLKSDQYWRAVVDDFAIDVIPTPCPWRDVDMPMAREREEATAEESRAKVIKTNPQRPSKWLRWPCSKKKPEKKS